VDVEAGISQYNVYWGTASPDTSPVTTPTATTDQPFYSPPAVTTAGTYYLRVQAVNTANLTSNWVDMFTYVKNNSLPDASSAVPTYIGTMVRSGTIDSTSDDGTTVTGLTPGKNYIIQAWGYFNITSSTFGSTDNLAFKDSINPLLDLPPNFTNNPPTLYIKQLYNSNNSSTNILRGYLFTPDSTGKITLYINDTDYTNNKGALNFAIFDYDPMYDIGKTYSNECETDGMHTNFFDASYWLNNSVDARTGNFSYSATDFSIAGKAGPMVLSRTYNSALSY
jgi:hypothetical protein